MTTLQEAARKALYALEASIDGDHPYYEDQLTAIESLRTALAQQGEQAKPVAYITDTHQGPMVWTPEMYGEACTYCDDGEFPVPLYTAAPAPVAQQGEQQQQVVKEVVVHADYRAMWQEVTRQNQQLCAALSAAPAPQPAQDVPEVGFGNMPYSPYLFGGLRFKMNFDKSGNATNFHGVESALQGAWVALVDATDNCHLQSAQPVVNQQMTTVKESLTPQSAQPVAQPLTLEQILDIVKKLDETPDMSHVDVLKTFARAIEKAHGINYEK